MTDTLFNSFITSNNINDCQITSALKFMICNFSRNPIKSQEKEEQINKFLDIKLWVLGENGVLNCQLWTCRAQNNDWIFLRFRTFCSPNNVSGWISRSSTLLWMFIIKQDKMEHSARHYCWKNTLFLTHQLLMGCIMKIKISKNDLKHENRVTVVVKKTE